MQMRPLLFGAAGLCGLVALVASLPARAQTANISVSVNGTVTTPGTYQSANVFLATCNGTEVYNSTAGDPAIKQLTWTPQTNDTIFWDTAADCNTGNTVTNDAGGIISGSDTTGPITPLPSTGSAIYGVGAGNVSIDLRQVLSSFLSVMQPAIHYDGGAGPCYPPSGPTPPLYVCITQSQSSYSGFNPYGGGSSLSIAWYMQVIYDTNPPPAPTGLTGTSGDGNVSLNWTYSSAALAPDHYLVYYQPDPTPGITPNSDGTCTGSSFARQQLWRHWTAGDGGCDAGVDDAGNCLAQPDAGGPVDNTPGVCGGCQAFTDCQNSTSSICLVDSLGNTYCSNSCDPDAGFLPSGGNLGCPLGFACLHATDINGSRAGTACVATDDFCRPSATTCGACVTASDCCSNGVCAASVDGGVPFCALPCADGGVNGNGAGACLGDTSCQAIASGSFSNQVCAPTSGNCYDPTPLSAVLDGGGLALNAGTDAGLGGSGITPTSWQSANIPSTSSSAQINGLTNGVCYDLVVQTILADGTQGEVSSAIVLAPVLNYNFWRLYPGAGGTDQGGFHCQQGGGATGVLAAMAGVLGLGLVRRRRRRSVKPRLGPGA